MEEKKKSRFWEKFISCIVLALVFGLVAGATFSGVVYLSREITGISAMAGNLFLKENTPEDVKLDEKDHSAAFDGETNKIVTQAFDVSGMVTDAMPAIVAVTNTGVYERNSWFGRYQQEYTSCGSGIIINQDEDNIYVATNYHVVSGAKNLSVTFMDGTEVEGVIKGSDSSVDLAIIALALKDIPASTKSVISVASIGDSESLMVGQPAIVIGNALGYGQSVTLGVVSALNREVEIEGNNGSVVTNYLIQTDAAVNPGNSGGAMLDVNGDVIGIVSAKYSSTDVEGMGYAIPISQAVSILEQMIKKDVVSSEETGYLGVAGLDITSANAQANMPKGVYVTQVVEGSAAEQIGIKKGDIITSFDGRKVTSMNSLSNIMKYIPAGSTVKITVAKESDNYKEATYEVTLTNRNITLTR